MIADRHPVGGEHEHRPALVVERDADPHRLDPDAGDRGAGRRQVERQVLGAAVAAAEVRPQAEPGQRRGGAGAKVGAEQVGRQLHDRSGVADLDVHGRHDPQVPARTGLGAQPEPTGRDADRHLDGVAGHGRAGRQQVGDHTQPGVEVPRVAEHLVEPVGESRKPAAEQLVDRQRRQVVGEAEQGGDRMQRPVVGRGLGLHQAEHQLDHGVLEMLRRVEAELEVLRLSAGQLQLAEGQADRGRVVAGVGGGDVDLHTDAAEVELAGRGRGRVEHDGALQPDPAAGPAQQQRADGRRAGAAGRLEQRDVQPGVGRGPRIRAGGRGRRQLDAEPDPDAGRCRLEDDADREVGVVVVDERQEGAALRVGVDGAVVEHRCRGTRPARPAGRRRRAPS